MHLSNLRRLALTATAIFAAAAPAFAQTTLTLTDSNATTLRGGTYASTAFGVAAIVETRASSDPTYVRRALFKFDTNTTLAQGTPIASAKLTITVAAGSDPETRQLAAYHETSPYDQRVATWMLRSAGTKWSAGGGDKAARYAVGTITGTSGSKVTFDVTTLVNAIVRGDFGSSRYTRILLIDEGASSKLSYKQIYSDDAADPSVRPTLTIVTGKVATKPATTPTTGPVTTPVPAPVTTPVPAPVTTGGVNLRILQWNTHHGGFGTDNVYSPDRIATWAAKMQPDVVMFNEIERSDYWGNQDQPVVYRNLLQAKTGRTWYYVFAQEFGQWSSTGKGNLILSRYPITWSTQHELVHNGDRSIAAASITVNGRNITLISTHLDPDSQPLRLLQATEITTWAAPQPENRIIAGDMNAWPDQTSIAQYNKSYFDSWAVAVSRGSALAFTGNTGQTKSGRIDYIFYSKSSANLSVVSSQVYDTRDARGVMPSDHRPVLTVFNVK